jgi:hypothetical protein
MKNKTYLVTNRSAGIVGYAIPEMGIKNREFQPNETKKISAEELRNLTYIPGGTALMRDYLQIRDPEAREELVGKVEPEYNMSIDDVKKLIQFGSMDEWLDCLDFASEGVIDIIKTLSVELPLTDTNKMEAFKKKKGIDLARAIRAKQEEDAENLAASSGQLEPAAQRRVQPKAEEPATPARRTTGSKYKVVNKAE